MSISFKHLHLDIRLLPSLKIMRMPSQERMHLTFKWTSMRPKSLPTMPILLHYRSGKLLELQKSQSRRVAMARGILVIFLSSWKVYIFDIIREINFSEPCALVYTEISSDGVRIVSAGVLMPCTHYLRFRMSTLSTSSILLSQYFCTRIPHLRSI